MDKNKGTNWYQDKLTYRVAPFWVNCINPAAHRINVNVWMGFCKNEKIPMWPMCGDCFDMDWSIIAHVMTSRLGRDCMYFWDKYVTRRNHKYWGCTLPYTIGRDYVKMQIRRTETYIGALMWDKYDMCPF